MDRSLNARRWQLRALVSASCLLTIVSLVVLKGGSRVAAAPGENSIPSFKKLLSTGQTPSFRAVKSRLSSFNFTDSDGDKITPNGPPYTVTLSAAPPNGSAIGQGQIITYTITIANGPGADVTSGNGFIRMFSTSTLETAFQFNPAFPSGVKTQPGAGSTWGPCTITPNGNGTNNFTCYSGDGIGGGADTFAANQSVVLTVDALVSNAAASGPINETAFFEEDKDGNGVDEVFIATNTLTHQVAPAADLGITKTSQTATAAANDPANSILAGGASVQMTTIGNLGNEGAGDVSYVMTVSNISANDATNVQIQDAIPAGPYQLVNNPAPPNSPGFPVGGPVTGQPIIPSAPGVMAVSLVSDTGGPPTGTATSFAFGCHNFAIGSTLICTPGNNTAINPSFIAGTLPRGFLARIAYRMRALPAAGPGSIVSDVARISSIGAADPNTGNNTSVPTQNSVIAKTDLGITKQTSNPTPVAGGAAFAYTLVVTNNGPSDARNIVVTDPLPPGVVLANNNIAVVNNPSLPGYGLICSGPANGTNGTVTCNGSLPGPTTNPVAVSTSTITIVGQIVANVASGVRTNTATVISDTQETSPNVAPNTASVQQNIQVDAPLSISKAGPAIVCPDDTYTYHITVNNGGSSTALNATISDPLPANTTFLNLSGNGGLATGCSHNGGTPGIVTCSAVNIPTGQSTLDITVKLAASASGPSVANTATITNAGTGSIAVGASTTTATVGCVTTLSIGNATVTEGTGGTTNATFTVTMSAASSETVTVDYVTSDVTATSPADYTSQAGTLIFAPGVTTRSIIVPVIPDNVPEPTETFLVTLVNPTNSTITTAQGTGTINDDDAAGSFQFSAATSTIGEAGPTVTLTVNRSGDTSGVASVGFETSDVTALQKSDYTFNSGILQFGPGDTSKTLKVSIVDDALVEGAETFRVNLVNPSGNFVINSPGFNTVTITDNDAAPGPNPIDNTSFFVRQQYLDFLGREPDAAGLAFWTNNINSCGADANCIAVKRIDTSAAFFLSIEFQETGGNVIRIQRVAFGKTSLDAALRVPYLTFMRDSRQVGNGVVIGQVGAEALLDANKLAYATQVVSSPAFAARFPVAPAGVYVDALFASAGVSPIASERTAAINAFGTGGTIGRIAALRNVADSLSVRQAESAPSFVLAEYYGYLRRNPTDAPDFNDVGYQFWLTKLVFFNGDFRTAEMVKAFLTSSEYRGRFGTP